MINKLILFISIVLPLIYIICGLFKKRKKKKIIIKRIIIGLLLFLIMNLIRWIAFKKDDTPKIDISTTTTMTTTTTTSTTTTTTTTTTTKTTKTTTSTTTTKVKDVASYNKTSKGYSIEHKNGAYYIDGYLLVNKTYALDKDFVPSNTHITVTDSMDGFCKECLDKEAYSEWSQMKSDAAALGFKLWNQSGYRSYDYQERLYNKYVKNKGVTAADKSSARPGHSEHQSGLAFDLNNIETSFKDKPEGKWVNDNCYLYGYIIRFPEGKSDETGYMFEPWHIRYVGKELAKALYNNGSWITMESYFGIDSKYE